MQYFRIQLQTRSMIAYKLTQNCIVGMMLTRAIVSLAVITQMCLNHIAFRRLILLISDYQFHNLAHLF